MKQITFSDVAHFYLGCDVLSFDTEKATLVAVYANREYTIQYKEGDWRGKFGVRKEGEIKPVLYSLDSMTQEQIREFGEIINEKTNVDWSSPESALVQHFKGQIKNWARATEWLCRNRFDVFNLIPSGQSISTEEI